MNDPSQGIQRELLPHIHLVSTYRFPQLPQIHPEKVAEWLLAAPKISREQAPFYWTYLDRPQDMTIFLVWQTMALGVEFPSDGYIWTPQETALKFQVQSGYTLEMYHHKVGYAPGEPLATHSRRRYRLLPPQVPGIQTVQPDPSLWIVHYTTAEPSERIPPNIIPIDMRVQQIMNTRQYLQSQGQIVQKDFMLHDRAQWPTIAFPRNGPQGAALNEQKIPLTRIPQTIAYPTQSPIATHPSKRIRTQPNTPGGIAVFEIDEQEDTSRGDYFDHITPREISMMRYKQNHEWMEEVISSPYSMNRIIPTDLGLGVRGELASLTNGIFDAPLDPDRDISYHNYVGRLDPEKAEEFRKRVNAKIAQTNIEIEKLKEKHLKRLKRGQKGSIFRTAEKELCQAVNNPSDMGSEVWRLEGYIEENESERVKAPLSVPPKVSDILAKVEASIECHAEPVKELLRIQEGGLEESHLIPSSQFATYSLDFPFPNRVG
ncbi:SWI/SNF and RSC complexes subunit ssr4 [Erysiphe necator]|uniref:Putative fungal duf1750 n=1 Tax=Uncinula necator TaxID=52586 RepID=A0A0B1P030_UNCNE|nr:SWI/SNF and RSC complexes subunit ssr4 [Erysiphe necator]KHJ31593.1 putative fungal duf1750 [Erysiphe necator]